MSMQIYTDTSEAGMREISKTHFFDSLTCFDVLTDVTVKQSDTLTQVMSPNIPNWLTNAVFDCDIPADDINTVIDDIVQTYSANGVAPFWRVLPDDKPPSLEDALVKKGFEYKTTHIAMSIDLQNLNEDITLADNISIERIANRDEMRTKHKAFMSMPEGKSFASLMLDIFDHSGYSEGADWQHYVGLLDGEPVAYGSAFYATGVVGIYNVGTRPEARKRGMGSAITLRCLLDAREKGYRVGSLQSSQMAFTLYQKLGFKHDFDIKYYAPASHAH